MSISERITLIRGSESRSVFSKRLEIKENTLRNYEKGLSLPNSDMVAKICDLFQVSPYWLLFGRDPIRLGEPAPEPQTPAEHPVIPTKTAEHCPRCERLEAELEEERKERRELNAENRQLLKENGDLKARCATLEERQRKVIHHELEPEEVNPGFVVGKRLTISSSELLNRT